MEPEVLSRELRTGSGGYLERRRKTVGLALIAAGAMMPISLYQTGLIPHLPEPPLPGLDADAVDAAGRAYAIPATPDAILGLGGYAATALAAMGGPDRFRHHPWIPIAHSGGHRVWEHPFTPRLSRGERISLRVLPPIPAPEVRTRGAERVRLEVQHRLKAAALDGTMAPPRRFAPARDGFWDGYAYEIAPAFPALAAEVAAYRSRPPKRGAARSDLS